ncbi:hypothetical protein Tco_0490058 [Tanacetum coccineum]
MGDENPIRTLGDYSKPSYEGYRNTIELHEGNNVVTLRSDTIRLVQNGCSFHGLWSEDPNQHLKDFLKLVDSLDLGFILTWEDLTTRFLAQFFPPERIAKLHPWRAAKAEFLHFSKSYSSKPSAPSTRNQFRGSSTRLHGNTHRKDGKEEKTVEYNRPVDKGIMEPGKSNEEEPPKEVNMKNEVERKADDKPAKSTEENVTKNEKDEPAGASSSQL